MIENIVDSILERRARFVAKAGKRVLFMPSHLHVVPGQKIVAHGEVYEVTAVDWTNIRMTLHPRLLHDVTMSEFRHSNPIPYRWGDRYGKQPLETE